MDAGFPAVFSLWGGYYHGDEEKNICVFRWWWIQQKMLCEGVTPAVLQGEPLSSEWRGAVALSQQSSTSLVLQGVVSWTSLGHLHFTDISWPVVCEPRVGLTLTEYKEALSALRKNPAGSMVSRRWLREQDKRREWT